MVETTGAVVVVTAGGGETVAVGVSTEAVETSAVGDTEPCALTKVKECEARTTREKSVRMRAADAEQLRMMDVVEEGF